ncbi:MAG: alpha/beta fold hydrolase [Nocardioidaceae bacterium]
MSPGSMKKYAGVLAAAAGVVASGALAGVLAERNVAARRRTGGQVPLGSLRGERHVVIADDNLDLYAELDDVAAAAGPGAASTVGCPTVVFVHGYALNLDCWHFQREALRGRHRMVFFDQRSHGRSARSRSEHCSIAQLGRDLAAVLDQLAPEGTVVLVGHSMGGMAILALAGQHPEWFGSRVVGAALISTSAGGLNAMTLGLPGPPGRLLHRLSPAVVTGLARAPRLVERSRRAGSDIALNLTRRLAFGGPVPQEYVDFTDQMLSGTPFGVVADFFPGFGNHDMTQALGAFDDLATVVICGTRDSMTPISHSRRIAGAVRGASLLELPDAGHMVMLECHDAVDQALVELVDGSSRPTAA